MPDVDYQQVKELFFAAAELEARQREGFLLSACAGDEPLLAEVQSLLRSWNESPGFLDSPAIGRGPLSSALDLKHLLRDWQRYELEDCLGVGSQSLVYRATDRDDRRPVAIKLLTHLGWRSLARFRREAESQARITHPAVLELYEAGTVDGIPYLAMQLVNGPSLMEVRAQTSIEERVELLRRVAHGLQAAHDLGIVHRDVKPSNILVESGDDGALRPFLADFGIARHGDGAAVTRTGDLVGTLAYLAPERLDSPDHELDHRSDVYALGATLYELLTGRVPYATSSTLATLRSIRAGGQVPSCHELAHLPRRLQAILRHSLAASPAARYPSACALAEDLRRFLDGEAVRASAWARRRPWPGGGARSTLGLAGAAAVLTGLAALWLLGSPPGDRNRAPGHAR